MDAAWRFANYILNYRIKENKPITNLQLQKIIYLVNNDFYKRNKKFLIKPHNLFTATPYGPIIVDIYKELQWYWGISPIENWNYAKTKPWIDEENVQKDIDKYSDMNILDLIKLVTQSKITQANVDNIHKIPLSDIKKDIKGDF